MARFAFLVHALSPFHRGAIGVRGGRLGMVLQRTDGSSPGEITTICTLSLRGAGVGGGDIEGVVIAVPMTPAQLLSDQQLALERMVLAIERLGPVDAVGLGSLCAVVAGRGEALAARVSVPVTTGGAATAWALAANLRALLPAPAPAPALETPVSVALLGSRSPVGQAVAQELSAAGVSLRLDSVRAARGLAGAVGFSTPEAAAAGCGWLVGAGPTGGTLPASAVVPGARMVDVAIPGTLQGGPLPAGVQVFSGEAVATPAAWRPGFWGRAYHLLAGYGLSQVYACLLEPLVMASLQRTAPFALGRELSVADVRLLGEEATRLGFVPRLLPERGWRRWL